MKRYTYKQIMDKSFVSTKIDNLKKMSSAVAMLTNSHAPYKEVPVTVVNRLIRKEGVTAYKYISPVADITTKEVKYILSNVPIYRRSTDEPEAPTT